MRTRADEGTVRWVPRFSEIAILVFIASAYLLETQSGAAYFGLAQGLLGAAAVGVVLVSQRPSSGILVPWSAALLVLASTAVVISGGAITPEFRTFAINCIVGVALFQLMRDDRLVTVAISSLGLAGSISAITLISAFDMGAAAATPVTAAWELRMGASLPGSNPNIAGLYLAISFCASLSRAFVPRAQRSARVLWGVCSVLTLFAISLTGSRKALIYCGVAAIILVAYFSRRLLPLVAIAIAAGGWALINVDWLYVVVGHRLVGEGGVAESDGLRVTAAFEAVDAILAAPLGTGWGSSGRFLADLGYTHSNYLEVLVSVGLLGLVVYYSLHVLVISRWRRVSPAVRPAVMAFMVSGLTVDIFQVTYLYKGPMIVLALGAAAAMSIRESEVGVARTVGLDAGSRLRARRRIGA